MTGRCVQVLALVALCAAGVAKEKSLAKEKGDKGFSDFFYEDKADLGPTGKSPFFVLEPGFIMEYEGKEDGEKVVLIVKVLDETRTVDGVQTRIIEERESANGKLVEVSRNFFAISKRTNNVYYFGEDTKTYKDGQVKGTEGSWEAGVDGARYGLIFPTTPIVGARYYQEIAPGAALDRAEILSTSETVTVPAGSFKHCVKTEETSPLEPKNVEYKLYAPGVGLIRDGALDLIKYGDEKTSASTAK